MKLVGTIRPPFLVLTPACVFLGIATAVTAGAAPIWWQIALIVAGAIFAHVGVNVFNEYQDYRSGLDATTKRTPFSGGSGTLQKHPELVTPALMLGISATLLAAGVGLYFVLRGHLLLLGLGGIGVLSIVLYTPWIARRPIACLLAPGLGFGTCMVVGAHVAMGAPLTWTTVVASSVPFFLVNDLLLLNQFPDIEPDRAVGRRNILITYGEKVGVPVYGVFLTLCYAAIIAGVVGKLFPTFSLVGIATLPLAVITFRGVAGGRNDAAKLVPTLGLNVVIVVLTPILMAVGILAG